MPAAPAHLVEYSAWEQRESPTAVGAELGAGKFFLWYRSERLELHRCGERGGVWVPVEELRRRSRGPSDLLQACGLDRRRQLRVWDLMAGLGVDASCLAVGGAQVRAVERQPLVALLLRDLCHRAQLVDVTVETGDAWECFEERPGPDVLYLDPMFPVRHKGALPGKRLQYLAELAMDEPCPLPELLTAGRRLAGRVVLKRRRRDPQVVAPDWQILGRTIRYDVYRGSGA